MFREQATELLNTKGIEINGVVCEIYEIEFYLQSPEHPDPFVHCHADHLTNNRWYFHKQRHNYRSGTFKGLDLTFGGESNYGGILIRSIRSPDLGVIEGPCRVVNYILEQLELEKISDLVPADAPPINAYEFPRLHIVDLATPSEGRIKAGPRIGLTLKRERPRGFEFLMKPYRFVRSTRFRKEQYMMALNPDTEWQADVTSQEFFERGKATPLEEIQRITKKQVDAYYMAAGGIHFKNPP